MFPPSSPTNSVLLLVTTAVILIASAAVEASPAVSREKRNALEQPGRTTGLNKGPNSRNAVSLTIKQQLGTF